MKNNYAEYDKLTNDIDKRLVSINKNIEAYNERIKKTEEAIINKKNEVDTYMNEEKISDYSRAKRELAELEDSMDVYMNSKNKLISSKEQEFGSDCLKKAREINAKKKAEIEGEVKARLLEIMDMYDEYINNSMKMRTTLLKLNEKINFEDTLSSDRVLNLNSEMMGFTNYLVGMIRGKHFR